MDCLRADGLKGEDMNHSLPADLLLCWAPYTDKHKHTYTHTHKNTCTLLPRRTMLSGDQKQTKI